MDEYIDLNRSFAPIPRDLEWSEDEDTLLFAFDEFGLSEKRKWDDLLPIPRVVILAEAGTGKTTEVRATTDRLRRENKSAFCFNLDYLSSDFQNSFIRGAEAEFTSWLSSEKEGWFFLDSVDEAKLIAPKNFRQAIRSFGNRLGQNLQRAHIFITGRVSEWNPKSDLSLLKARLPYKKPEEAPQKEDDNSFVNYDTASSDEITSIGKNPESPFEPSIFSLLPLDKAQIRTYSKTLGAIQIDAFLIAVERAEADIFAKRPMDLGYLVSYWNANGKIANRSKLMESHISLNLKERDPERGSVFPLTDEDARWGAELIAAAVILEKKTRIMVPDPAPDLDIRRGSIDPTDVCRHMNTGEIRALLQRPIFDRAIYGAVRFHERSVREFLTATWLRGLLSHEKRREIENLFFKVLCDQTVLVPSMRPILAWLVLFDDIIRDKTSRIAPEVFVQGGDPSSLSIEYRRNLLKRFCDAYANEEHKYFSFDLFEVRRFADPDLDDTVHCLLETHSGNEKIRQLLLRIVWQGELKGCAEMALAFALNETTDVYTRLCGIRAVATAGSDEQQKRLLHELIGTADLRDELIIGEIIEIFAPGEIPINEVFPLIRRVNRTAAYSSQIDRSLKDVCFKNCFDDDLITWIQGFLPLIKQPPLNKRGNFNISQKYGWILPIACLLAERLVQIEHPDALAHDVLEIISLSQAERSYIDLYWEKHSLNELVPKWSELNRALFWFDVNKMGERRKERKGNRLTDWWQVGFLSSRFWDFTHFDYERVIDDIRIKTNMDDRLVALSLAFHLYIEGGRGPNRLKKLKRAVRGVNELEKTLDRFLHPPKMSKEETQLRRREYELKRRQKRNEKARAENRQKWIEWLKENPHVLRNTSVAAKGNVWNATRYLLDELGKKRENRNKWARSKWEDLIQEFGQEVAEAYRDGCIEYWRNYRPKVRSEGISNPQSTPLAVVVGLSGLKMETLQAPQWPRNLTAQEAELACRYAMHEMNGFPGWLKKLHEPFASIVEKLILNEIEWEFSQYDGEKQCHYVLDDIYWHLDWIKPKISDQLLSFLKRYESKHDNTIQTTLKILLSCHDINKRTFIDIAKTKVNAPNIRTRQILWLTAWMCVEAESAFSTLVDIVNQFRDAAKATEFAMRFVVALFGEWWERKVIEHQDYLKPKILLALIKLMHNHIPSEGHMATTGTNSHELREKAHKALSRLFEQLLNIPGKPTYLALMELSKDHPDEAMRAHCLVHAKSRLEEDAEMEPWYPSDVAHFAEEVEKIPRNHKELHELAVSRLLDLKADLEDGRSSLAELLILAKAERLHRNAISDWLRNRSNRKYSVPQEEELADRTKPDIQFHGCGFDGPVPIELKIADNNWSGPDLFERLHNQLCGQYLRDAGSNRGVFLIVCRGEQLHWKDPGSGKMVDFTALVQLLKAEAKKIITTDENIEGLEIIGIDLTRRLKKREPGDQGDHAS